MLLLTTTLGREGRHSVVWFLADRTNGCAIGTVLRPSAVVCYWYQNE